MKEAEILEAVMKHEGPVFLFDVPFSDAGKLGTLAAFELVEKKQILLKELFYLMAQVVGEDVGPHKFIHMVGSIMSTKMTWGGSWADSRWGEHGASRDTRGQSQS